MTNLVNGYLENIDKVKDFLQMLEDFLKGIKHLGKNNDNTLLHAAVSNKDLKTVTLILDLLNLIDTDTKSKFINAQNKNGDTAFHLAARSCQNTTNDKDQNKTCEAIAGLLDKNGALKNLANKGGEIVGVSDSSIESNSNNSSSPLSEYKSKILNMAGGFLNLGTSSSNNSNNNNNNGYLSNLFGTNQNQNQLTNITTEVSVDNLKNSKNSLENINTEVSVDKMNKISEGGDSSSSVSSFSENSISKSSSESKSNSNSKSNSISESKSDSNSNSNSNTNTNSNSLSEAKSNQMSTESSLESSYKQSGGGNNILSDTSTFVKTLLNQFNTMKGGSKLSGGNRLNSGSMKDVLMNGGNNNSNSNRVTGERNLPSLSDYAITESSELYGGKEFGLSREQMKESSNIHDQVVQIFLDSGKSEEEARVIKMALYKYTKEHNPDLNNLDRARKMKEYAEDKSILKKLDLESSRKIYEENKKAKSQMSTESKMSSDKTTTEMTEKETSESEDEESSEKPKKKTTKKATKKSKK